MDFGAIIFLILLALGAPVVLGIFIFILYREQIKLKKSIQRLHLKFSSMDGGEIKTPPVAPKAPPANAETQTPLPNIPSEKPDLITKPKENSLKRLEESLSSRWMLWVGGLAVALGGGFLVKYSIDSGLLSPVVRVSLGFIMGVILTLGGEILRQRRIKAGWLKDAPDYLPIAISAAGLFSAFAAIYAAYALYDLLPALMAFFALAALSYVASGLAWYQGKFFAYLGLIGGIMVPLLVTTGPSSAWGLFPYLLAIIAASLWVSRQKAWADVAATTLLLALLWVIIWIPTSWQTGDVIPVGIYLLLLGGLNGLMLGGATPERATVRSFNAMIKGSFITRLSDIVMIIVVILMASLVRMDHYSLYGFILVVTGLAAQAYAVHRSPAADTGGIIALGGVLFLFATWHIPNLWEFKMALNEFDRLNTAWAPTAPPALDKFVANALIFAFAVGGMIYFRLHKLMRRDIWASMGNIIPVLMLIIAYWRIENWGTSLNFTFAAVLLAGLFTLAVIRLSAERQAENIGPIAAYAAGATTAVSIGIAMILRDAWLSFALTLQIVALGHIWQITKVRGLRSLALILAAIVLLRLFLNESIFDYGGGEALPVFNWLFYAYGLGAAFFAYAAHIFRPDGEEDRLMSVLKAGAIMLAIAFVTLEIRVLFSEGHNLSSLPTVAESAMQSLNWAVATTLLFWFEIKNNDRLLGMLRRFMTFVTLFGLIIGGGMVNNVFFSPVDVGTIPVFNLQLLQFFIPGLLYGCKAYLAGRVQKPRSKKLYGAMAFLVIWFWMTAEIYNFFHPAGLYTSATDWEWYAYSMVWMLYAVALLLAGLRFQQATIRKAGLGVLAIVVVKVFLVDMNQLEGLARALSFIGLGGALIGLGYLYQKLGLKNAQS